MDKASILIKIAQAEEHLQGLKAWRIQEAISLAQAMRNQNHAIDQILILNKAIDGLEVELEFLKGASKI